MHREEIAFVFQFFDQLKLMVDLSLRLVRGALWVAPLSPSQVKPFQRLKQRLAGWLSSGYYGKSHPVKK